MAGNDISIISGILIFFFLTSLIIPIVTSGFQDDKTQLNTSQVTDFNNDILSMANQTTIEENTFSIWNPASWIPNELLAFIRVIWLFIQIIFWGFGLIPFWLNLIIYMPLRIILALTIARNIWPGGGG